MLTPEAELRALSHAAKQLLLHVVYNPLAISSAPAVAWGERPPFYADLHS